MKSRDAVNVIVIMRRSCTTYHGTIDIWQASANLCCLVGYVVAYSRKPQFIDDKGGLIYTAHTWFVKIKHLEKTWSTNRRFFHFSEYGNLG